MKRITFSILCLLILMFSMVSFLLPEPVQAVGDRYFVMGQIVVEDGSDGHIAVSPTRVVADGNITVGTAGNLHVYMASGTTGHIDSGTATITGSPVTLAEGLNDITAEGVGDFAVDITIGTAANWSSHNSWSAASGGACTATEPDSGLDANFDANSFTAASQVVTVDATANCLNMDWTGSTNTPTLAVNNYLDTYGNITMIAAMTVTQSGGYAIRTNAASGTQSVSILTNLPCFFSIRNAGTGITQLTQNLTMTSHGVVVSSGTFDTNGKTVTVGTVDGFTTTSSSAKTVTLGASTINLGTNWDMETGGGTVTLSANTATITITGTGDFKGNSLTTYNTVNLNGTAHTISGSNTFVNLTRNGTATKTDTLTLTSGTTQTVTGTCALIGNSATNRLLVQSSTLGTAATLHVQTDVAANWPGTNAVDFMDITSTHAVDFSAGGLNPAAYAGDCGGNTGITCTASDTQTSNAAGDWDDATKWTGTAISRVPLPQDDVNCSHSMTVDMPRIGRSITFSGTPALTYSVANSLYGSLVMVSGASGTWTTSAEILFCGRNLTDTVTFGGKGFSVLRFNNPNGTYTFQSSSFTIGNSISMFWGNVDFNDQSFTVPVLWLNGTKARTLSLGNGTITITGLSNYFLYNPSNLTVVGEGSTIVCTRADATAHTFAGGGLSYNNITVQGAGNYALTISGNNTFNTFTVDRSVASKTLTLTASSNQTMADFSCPTSGTNVLTINSTGAAATLTKTGGGGEMIDYVNLSNNTGSPASTWYYGLNNTIGAGVTGWNVGSTANVTSIAASSIEENSSTCSGNITDLNYSEPATITGIQYDIDSGAPYANDAHTHGTYPVGVFNQGLTGLTEGELYYYRAYATDIAGTGYGGELNFLTKPDEPTIFTSVSGTTTGRISLAWIKGTGAQKTYIRGNIGSAPTFSGAGGSTLYNDVGTSLNHDGLTGGDHWYYRAWSWATEGGLEQYSDLYASTDVVAVVTPTVTTQAATLVEENTAILNGTITNTGGINSSSRGGEYDTNSGAPYAHSSVDAGSFTAVAFTKSIAGLNAGTLYYARARATTGALVGYGAEITFLTKPEPPTNIVTTQVGINQLNVTWTKGTGALRTLVRYKDGSFPTSITDGTLAYFDTGTAVIIAGLMENKTYFVKAWSERTEGGWQQYSDNDAESHERSSGVADNMMNTIVALSMALITIICMFVLIGQLGQGYPIEDIIKLVIIAVLGIICFVVMKGVVGM